MASFSKAFPHVLVGSSDHVRIKQKLREYVQFERKGLSNSKGGWTSNRNLVTMPVSGLNLEGEIARLGKQRTGSVNVFEVGCGKGHTLRTLKTMLGSKVHVDGITLTKKAADYAAGRFDHPSDVYANLSEVFKMLPAGGTEIKKIEPAKVRIGLIEGEDIAGQDLIFSFEALRYTFDHARALEKITNGLNLNGRAILEVPKDFLKEDNSKIREHLKQNGIEFSRGDVASKIFGMMGKESRHFIVLQRNSDKKVDLSSFYKIRLNESSQDPGNRTD